MTPAEFEELERGQRDTFTPGQVLENRLGFDRGLLLTQAALWETLYMKPRKKRGSTIRDRSSCPHKGGHLPLNGDINPEWIGADLHVGRATSQTKQAIVRPESTSNNRRSWDSPPVHPQPGF